MRKPIKDKKLKKREKSNNEKVIVNKYGDKIRKTINYDKDKPPHW